MGYMPHTGLKHGPANHMVGTGRFLVNQKLHLHIDPAVIALEAINLRYIAQVCAVHNWRLLAFFHSAAALFTALASAAPIFSPDVMIALPNGDRPDVRRQNHCRPKPPDKFAPPWAIGTSHPQSACSGESRCVL